MSESTGNSVQVFVYDGPPDSEVKAPKEHVRLGRTDILRAGVQVVRKGGGNNLHSHSGNDGFWFVLQGRARFYGDNDEVMGEFDPGEGVIIPRDAPYWFESASDDDLELLHVSARDPRVAPDKRTDHQPRKRRAKVAG